MEESWSLFLPSKYAIETVLLHTCRKQSSYSPEISDPEWSNDEILRAQTRTQTFACHQHKEF